MGASERRKISNLTDVTAIARDGESVAGGSAGGVRDCPEPDA
jgi:hypothetical protein